MGPDNMEVWARGVCLGSDTAAIAAVAAAAIIEIVKSLNYGPSV